MLNCWTKLVLCIVILQGQTNVLGILIEMKPTQDIIYKSRFSRIQVCARRNVGAKCNVGTDVTCAIEMALNTDTEGTSYTFKELVATRNLSTGVYYIRCSSANGLWSGSVKKLLLPNRATFVDCSAAPKLITFDNIWPVHRVCCARHRLRTEWVRHFDKRWSVCQPLSCSVSSRQLIVFDGELFFREMRSAPPKKVWIHCGGTFSHAIYLSKPPVTYIQLKLNPSDAVILKNEVKTLEVCVGWNDEDGCEKDLDEHAFIHCLVRGVDPLSGLPQQQILSFMDRINVSKIKQGIYEINCSESSMNIKTTVIKAIIEFGSYQWDCSYAPSLIVLDSGKNEYEFCRYEVSTTSEWFTILENLNLIRRPFYCEAYPPGLVFFNGTLRMDKSTASTGLYNIACLDGQFEKTVIFTHHMEDMTIRISPSKLAIDNSALGHIRVFPELKGAKQSVQSELRYLFPVTCHLKYLFMYDNFKMNFEETIAFRQLPEGPLELNCSIKSLKISQFFVKDIISTGKYPRICNIPTSVKLDAGSGIYVNCPDYSLKKSIIHAAAAFDSDVQCVDLDDNMKYEGGKLTYVDGEKALGYRPLICSGKKRNAKVLVEGAEWRLEPDQIQPFYIFKGGRKGINFFFTNGTYKLKDVDYRCAMDIDEEALGENNLKEGNFIDFHKLEDNLRSARYTVVCHAQKGARKGKTRLTIVRDDELKLTIQSPGQSVYWDDEPLPRFYCTLTVVDNPDLLGAEKNKTRWACTNPDHNLTEYGNQLRVNNETAFGEHWCYCYYTRSWAGEQLFKFVDFVFIFRSGLTRAPEITYTPVEKFVYTFDEDLPEIKCKSDQAVTWSRISGSLTRVKDEKKSSDVLVIGNEFYEGSIHGTFRCSSEFRNSCLSSLVLIMQTDLNLNLEFRPRNRHQEPGRTFTCRSKSIRSFSHDIRIRGISTGALTFINQRSVKAGKTDPRNPFLHLVCEMDLTYLGEELGKQRSEFLYQLAERVPLSVYPKDKSLQHGSNILCFNLLVGSVSPPHFWLRFYPTDYQFVKLFGTKELIDKNFVGGDYSFYCQQFLPYRPVCKIAISFAVEELPSKVRLMPVHVNKSLDFIECTCNGHPKDNILFHWKIIKSPDGYFKIVGNRLHITHFSMYGRLRVRCWITCPGLVQTIFDEQEYLYVAIQAIRESSPERSKVLNILLYGLVIISCVRSYAARYTETKKPTLKARLSPRLTTAHL
ncbi:unnamed protein product [Calicophoron daubneyi]|uniref:Ig-like domain-containing protein n=1 Tax=Calicophoron daubneyi TaxID=300641 RepID=A0AAV2U0V2_CALDB